MSLPLSGRGGSSSGTRSRSPHRSIPLHPPDLAAENARAAAIRAVAQAREAKEGIEAAKAAVAAAGLNTPDIAAALQQAGYAAAEAQAAAVDARQWASMAVVASRAANPDR